MEVLPFYVLTPIFLQIWLQQVHYSRKTGHNPSFSSTSLIFCYSVTTMGVSGLSFVSLRFLSGQSGCHCNNVYFCNNGFFGRNWRISGLWYKEAYGLQIEGPLHRDIDLVINLLLLINTQQLAFSPVTLEFPQPWSKSSAHYCDQMLRSSCFYFSTVFCVTL